VRADIDIGENCRGFRVPINVHKISLCIHIILVLTVFLMCGPLLISQTDPNLESRLDVWSLSGSAVRSNSSYRSQRGVNSRIRNSRREKESGARNWNSVAEIGWRIDKCAAAVMERPDYLGEFRVKWEYLSSVTDDAYLVIGRR